MRFSDKAFYATGPSLAKVMVHEKGVFSANQSVPYTEYVEARRQYLRKVPNAEGALAFLDGFVPNVGVFAGSFDPFHKGHFNVLLKAEKIFDKVIIAFGANPEKSVHESKVPRTISDRQIAHYDGLLTDFIAGLGHDAVVIRGLRNSTDFQYEQNQYRYLQELMPGIKIVNIFCDKEYEHISSSGIRTLQKFNRHQDYLLE